MFLPPLIILPFDDAAVWAYGELRAELRQDAWMQLENWAVCSFGAFRAPNSCRWAPCRPTANESSTHPSSKPA